jgi:malonate transporter and related proteins
MTQILSVTAPIYILIAVGFLAVRSGLLSKTDNQALGRFVLYFCVPPLLFRAFAQRSLGEVVNFSFLAAYAAGSLVVLALGYLYVRRARGRATPAAAMQAMGMCSSNSAFVGYPIALQLLGPTAGVALALCTLIENLLTMPISLALAESSNAGEGAGWRKAVMQSLRGLSRNPMIIGITLGIVFSALDVHLPAVVATTIQLVATAASPVALFVIGGSLVGLTLTGQRGDITGVAIGKLIVHPLAVWFAFWLSPTADASLMFVAVVFASVPMLSIYPVLGQKYGQQGFCAATLLATTIASFFTISALIWTHSHHPAIFEKAALTSPR